MIGTHTTNFESDLRRVILAALPLSRTAMARRSELEAMATKDLLLVFHNWRDRLVHPHPRVLLCSDVLAASSAYNIHQENINRLFKKIMSGEPITPHLSRSICHGWEPGGKSSVSDYDLMLNDWGIHHLHLAQDLDPDGFVNRVNADEVLAVIFRPSIAYVLDVIRHGEWAVPRLVEIAVRSWPEEELFLPLVGVLPGIDWKDSERLRLRKKGLPSSITVDGVPFVSSSFMATARNTLQAAREASKVLHKLAYIESHLSELDRDFQKAALLAGVQPPLCPQYEIVGVTNPQSFGFGIREMTTDLVVAVTK